MYAEQGDVGLDKRGGGAPGNVLTVLDMVFPGPLLKWMMC